MGSWRRFCVTHSSQGGLTFLQEVLSAHVTPRNLTRTQAQSLRSLPFVVGAGTKTEVHPGLILQVTSSCPGPTGLSTIGLGGNEKGQEVKGLS